MPKLLLSATRLVYLTLFDIPHSGYISPEAMVALLSVLSGLKALSLGFQSPQSRPDLETRRWPPSKRSVIPALDFFLFKGVIEYLVELVTRMKTPQVAEMDITFFNQIDLDRPRHAQFINCTPTLRALDEARVQFDDTTAIVKLRYRTFEFDIDDLLINISCREPDWQLSSIEQVCNSSLHPLSTVVDLYIEHRYWKLVWKNDPIENILWLQLLLPFTSVKNLYLSKEFAPGIAAALQALSGSRITEVLPSLQNIFVEGIGASRRLVKDTVKFVAARRFSGGPISISLWRASLTVIPIVMDDVKLPSRYLSSQVDNRPRTVEIDAPLTAGTTVEERAAILRDYNASMVDINAQARAEYQRRVEAKPERRLQN